MYKCIECIQIICSAVSLLDACMDSFIDDGIICKHICLIYCMVKVYYLTLIFMCILGALNRPTPHFQQQKFCLPFRGTDDELAVWETTARQMRVEISGGE